MTKLEQLYNTNQNLKKLGIKLQEEPLPQKMNKSYYNVKPGTNN